MKHWINSFHPFLKFDACLRDLTKLNDSFFVLLYMLGLTATNYSKSDKDSQQSGALTPFKIYNEIKCTLAKLIWNQLKIQSSCK